MSYTLARKHRTSFAVALGVQAARIQPDQTTKRQMREISRLEAAPQPLRIIDAETTTAEQMMLRAVFRGSAFRECRPVTLATPVL